MFEHHLICIFFVIVCVNGPDQQQLAWTVVLILQQRWQITSVSLHPSQQKGIQKSPPVVASRQRHHRSAVQPTFLFNTFCVCWLQYGQFVISPFWAMLVIVAYCLFSMTTTVVGGAIMGGPIIGGFIIGGGINPGGCIIWLL